MGAALTKQAVDAEREGGGLAEDEPTVSALGPWALTWRRLRADRVALAAGVALLVIIVSCFIGAPALSRLLGHGPNDPFPYAVSQNLKPVGPWTHVPDVNEFVEIGKDHPRTLLILGGDGTLGRDLFLRLLYGGQASLSIALGATLLALLIGVPLGILAGYLGGWSDWTISRVTEIFMGFPLLLFLVAIGYTVGSRLSDVTLGVFQPGVLALLFLIGIFSWFMPARVIRAQVLALCEEQFVEAARTMGASDRWIMRKHVLPHLTATIAVWGTIIFAGFLVFEAAISVLNVGIKLPTASWGNLLSTDSGTLLVYDPYRFQGQVVAEKSNWVVFSPTVALFLTVVALALFGEGLRRAIDPWSTE